jgi:hypothetical protein
MRSQQSYSAADEVIEDLKSLGFDYSQGREEIARVFDEDLWNGNWDSSTDFEMDYQPNMRDLRFIQEDEYEQHMEDDEDKPTNDLCYSAGHYVFFI